MEVNKQRDNWVDITKFLACIMITNSHCREIYPVPFLAIGGGFGNALFFIISGYLLANIKMTFIPWFKKRCGRVLPITLLFVVVNELVCLGTHIQGSDFYGFAGYYLDQYWFTFAIVIYYIVFYFIFSQKETLIILSFLVWLIGYVIIYVMLLDTSVFSVELGGFAPFKVYFYFGIMLMGGIIRKERERLCKGMGQQRKMAMVAFLILLVAFAGWTMEYAAVTVRGVAFQCQFLIHLFVLVFAVAFLFLIWNIQIGERHIVTLIANSTLEIYLVQITFLGILSKPVFPFNWLLFWCVAIIGGILVHSMADKIRNRRKLK